MCGIVGGVSERNVVPIILEGLSRLEYRGYDSAGLAVIDEKKNLNRQRVTGRVNQLIDECKKSGINGMVGIGHTRWATHGEVNIENAHPHFSHDMLAIIHNGIIENYAELKEELKKQGYKFESQTDTEVVIHLIHSRYVKTHDLLQSVKDTVAKLRGAYAIGVICKDNPDQLVCVRLGAPLVIGVGINEMFFASDISALLPVTQKVVYLEDGDIAAIKKDSWVIYDKDNRQIERKVFISDLSIGQTDLGQYRHYMQKEIFEQPQGVADTLKSLGNHFVPEIFGNAAKGIFEIISKIQILACGTSYNASMVAKYWIEEFAGLDCAIDIASEYHYRKIPSDPNTLIVNISQSGETADTISCVKYAHSLDMTNSLSICNVAESSLVRLSKLSVLTKAGPEIGVASTKAFTTQLIVLFFLANTLAKVRGRLSDSEEQERVKQIRRLPQLIVDTLALEDKIKIMAKEIEYKHHALFLGRHTLYPVAIEGALKLKEISYIHAEGYAAGELKHGPIALIDKDMPVITMLPTKLLYDKMKSNIQEVLARQGVVYLFTDADDDVTRRCHMVINMPTKDSP